MNRAGELAFGEQERAVSPNPVVRSSGRPVARSPCSVLLATMMCLALGGCAALTNPVAHGVPVRRLPPELLGVSKEALVEVAPDTLRLPPPDQYRLAPGDAIRILIPGVTRKGDQQSEDEMKFPVRSDGTVFLPMLDPVTVEGLTIEQAETAIRQAYTQRKLVPGDILRIYLAGILREPNQQAEVGVPITVRPNGTIILPQVEPIMVQGLTLEQVDAAIRRAYTVQKQILKPDQRIIVDLVTQRQGPELGFPGDLSLADRIQVEMAGQRLYEVVVIRRDLKDTFQSSGQTGTGSQLRIGTYRIGTVSAENIFGSQESDRSQIVKLEAGHNDVLHALLKTGGFPGLGAGEIVIRRSSSNPAAVPGVPSAPQLCLPGNLGQAFANLTGQVIRIPLRLYPDHPLPFTPDDIQLYTGDVVLVTSREPEFFYTGGLLPATENPLPTDYDLDVVEAVSRIQGPLVSGGVSTNNLSGSIIGLGIGADSPSRLTVLRRTPGLRQVRIQVDLNQALRDPRERILVQNGDILILQETPGEALSRYVTSILTAGLAYESQRGNTTRFVDVIVP
jgi:protein involved in polysaccharide export with SLBB domain